MKKSKKQKLVNLKIPWGSWDIHTGVWQPNPLLKMTVVEQMEQNIKNGYPVVKGVTSLYNHFNFKGKW